MHANDTCIQCHSQGKPLTNPIEGKYYDRPVGFHQGLNLSWQLKQVTPRVYITLCTKSFPCIRFLSRGAVGEVLAERAACREHRGAHASSARQPRQ